jgi:hypothetical protein
MSLLRTIESRISRLVEGAFGRMFASHVQPVELARRLVREMDSGRRETMREIYVPNVYEIYVSRDDMRELRDVQNALSSELSEYLAEHARRNGYAVATRPRVSFTMDRDLDLGVFGIATTFDETAEAQVESAAEASQTTVQPVIMLEPEAPAPAPTASKPARCVLLTPDGTYPVDSEKTSIGRGKSNTIVLNDGSVSREHAEIVHTPVGYLVRDLGSTNGVMVNGIKIQERRLDHGDELVFGSVSMRFEHVSLGVDGA